MGAIVRANGEGEDGERSMATTEVSEGKGNIQMYLNELMEWQTVTETEENTQGL